MKNNKLITGLVRIILITAAIFSLVRLSNAQPWIAQTSGTANDLRAVYFLDNLKGFIAGNAGTILYTINAGAADTNYRSNQRRPA
jgi:hypothetical protein